MPTIYTKDKVSSAVGEAARGAMGIPSSDPHNVVAYDNYLRRQHGGGDAAPASIDIGPVGKKFVAAGLLLLGWWTAPAAAAPAQAWVIPGFFLLLGTFGMIVGLLAGRGSGWRAFAFSRGVLGFVLRLLWAFRPRVWLLAWVPIAGVLIAYGSPHLRILYGPSGCHYLGLNGWESSGRYNCPLVRVFPLRNRWAR